MLFHRTVASAAGIVALLAAATGCADDGARSAPTTPSTIVITESATRHQDPPSPTAHPTKTATAPSGSTGPGSEYDVTCTGGPDEGTICTNPNHGAGDDPYGTGTPTTTKPR